MKFTKKEAWFILTCIIWIFVAWLVSPLFSLDRMEMDQVKWFIYRISLGISIMLIFFGKTLFDLLFSPGPSRKTALFNTIMLTLYLLVISAGLLFMVVRMISYYIQANPPETPDIDF